MVGKYGIRTNEGTAGNDALVAAAPTAKVSISTSTSVTGRSTNQQHPSLLETSNNSLLSTSSHCPNNDWMYSHTPLHTTTLLLFIYQYISLTALQLSLNITCGNISICFKVSASLQLDIAIPNQSLGDKIRIIFAHAQHTMVWLWQRGYTVQCKSASLSGLVPFITKLNCAVVWTGY